MIHHEMRYCDAGGHSLPVERARQVHTPWQGIPRDIPPPPTPPAEPGTELTGPEDYILELTGKGASCGRRVWRGSFTGL